MKLTVLQKDLNVALLHVSRFSQNRAQLPILGNIVFKTYDNKLELCATNLEMSIVTSIGAKVEKEGELAVPSKVISELVNNMSDGQIVLESEKESLIVSSQDMNSVVTCMNASDFPEIPRKTPKDSISINLEEIKKILDKSLFAVSIDETRPTLTGMLFSFSKTNLTVVATDGFRLSRKTLAIKGLLLEDLIIPKNILAEITRLEGDTVNFSYAKKENQVVFASNSSTLSSRLINGEFPNYKKIIPESSDYSLLIDTKDFLKAIKLSSVFARDASNIIRLKVDKNKVKVYSESKQSGKNEVSMDSKYEGDVPTMPLEIAFNYKFLEDFMTKVESETVKFGLTASDAPGVLIDPQDKSYLHLVMPVRI